MSRFLQIVFLVLSTGAVNGVTLHAQWQNISPPDLVHHLRSVSFVDEMRGYATGWIEYSSGTVQSVLARSVDGGDTWQFQGFDNVELNAMAFTDFEHGYLVGRSIPCNCPLLKQTTDGGATWHDVTYNEMSGSFRAVDFSDPLNGIIGGGDPETADGYAFSTVDGGNTFVQTFALPLAHVRRVNQLNKTTAFVTGGEVPEGENIVYKTTNANAPLGEVRWQPVSMFEGAVAIQGLTFTTESVGYALLNTLADGIFFGNLFKSTDGGETWNEIYRSLEYTYIGLAFLDAEHGVVVGANGAIAQTNDGGVTWSETVTGATQLLTWVDLVSPSVAYAVGTNGSILKYSAVASVHDEKSVEDGASITVRPNPVSSFGQLSLSSERTLVNARFALFDVYGREVLESTLQDGNGTVNLNGLTSGAYFYRLTSTDGTVLSGQVVVQ